MFTYSHANTPLGQSERAYYLSYFLTAVTYNSQLLSKALKQIFSSLILFLSSNFYFSLFSFFSYFSPVKLWFSIKLIATEFFQRHLIVGWLCNNTLKIRQLSPQDTQFQEDHKFANVFWVVLVLKTPTKCVRNTWVSVSS